MKQKSFVFIMRPNLGLPFQEGSANVVTFSGYTRNCQRYHYKISQDITCTRYHLVAIRYHLHKQGNWPVMALNQFLVGSYAEGVLPRLKKYHHLRLKNFPVWRLIEILVRMWKNWKVHFQKRKIGLL